MEIAYWIDPAGELHEVGRGIQARHARWMWRCRGIDGDRAEREGWHRLIAACDVGELFTYGRVAFTDRQRASVDSLAVQLGGLVVRPELFPL